MFTFHKKLTYFKDAFRTSCMELFLSIFINFASF